MHQEPSTYSSQMNMNPQFPEQEHLRCPRCDSNNTKFCYYNNYNLSQPRHFCKNCRRYWTKGGTLRNIPVGGGTRKNSKRSSNTNKRPANSSSPTSPAAAPPPPPPAQPKPEMFGLINNQMEVDGGRFSSLLRSSQLGNFLMDGLSPNMAVGSGEDCLIRNPTADVFRSSFLSVNHDNNQSGISGGGESSCWNGGENEWPDLSINTPGSSFH